MRPNSNTRRLGAVAGIASLLVATLAPAAEACTGIFLKATDGAAVHAGTLEFAIELDSEVLVVPRGFARSGDTPDGKPGLRWTTKYASVGAKGAGLLYIFDGLNEKGLAVGLFYFPGTAGYMPYTAADAAKTLAPWQIGSWLLETVATVEEARTAIAGIVAPAVVLKAWGFAPPVHYIVHDAAGNSIVIEYVGGKLTVSDNPLGVITHSPSVDWHMTNLRNYLNFSIYNAPPVMLGKVKLVPTGQGSGMLGMPGDFTPPSRFVRAVAFTQSILPATSGAETVLEAFHILNNFDIPKGAARDEKKDALGNVVADYTLWTSANDLKARRFYIRTHANSQIRSIDLMKMNLDAKDIAKFSIKGPELIRSLNP